MTAELIDGKAFAAALRGRIATAVATSTRREAGMSSRASTMAPR